MKFTHLLHLLVSMRVVYALTEESQATWLQRLKDALDDLDACENTPHGPIYGDVDCKTFINGKVRAHGDEVYKIFCHSTNKGKDQERKKTNTVDECMNACDVTNGCVGGDYYPGDQDCFLKSTGLSDGTIGKPSTGDPIAFYNVGYI